MRGNVVWFDDARGYGFLRPEGDGKDIFVHFTGIDSKAKRRNLQKGQLVEYEVIDNPDGRRFASNVRVVTE